MALSGSAAVDLQPSLKKKTAVSTSWIMLERNGNDNVLQVDRYAIMERVGIHARDLRILDPMLSYPSAILGREKVIVLNLEHIKAIITAEEVLVRDPTDDDVIPIVQQLRRKLYEENEFPFEIRALEVALEAICSFLDARARKLETDTCPALDDLTSKISSSKLNGVRKLKSAMTPLTHRVQKIRDVLENLLGDDDDMAGLYLSRKMAVSCVAPYCFPSSPTLGSRVRRDVEELEMLLKAYFMQIDGTLNKLNTLREHIDNTEDHINIQLDHQRNLVIQLELFLSSGTVCLSISFLVCVIFGMNIPYTWNEGHDYMFKWVVICTGIVSGSLFFSILSYARRKGLVGS